MFDAYDVTAEIGGPPLTRRLTMNRSYTVRASLAIFAIWILGELIGVFPESFDQNSGYWWFFGWIIFAAWIRVFILFWQTLAFALQSRSLGWVVGHVMFGPLASIGYYLSTEPQPLNTSSKAPRFGRSQPIKINKQDPTDPSGR